MIKSLQVSTASIAANPPGETKAEESSSESEIESEFDPIARMAQSAPVESEIKKVRFKSLLKSSVAPNDKSSDANKAKIDDVFERTDY